MESEAKQAAFEGWAIVEMMGHRKEIGYVTTQAYGQAVMFRVDTPELPEREIVLERPDYMPVNGTYETVPAGSRVKREKVPGRSCLVAPGSLYAINPCDEAAAREALERSTHRPLMLIERGKPLEIEAAADDYGESCEGCGAPTPDQCTCGEDDDECPI